MENYNQEEVDFIVRNSLRNIELFKNCKEKNIIETFKDLFAGNLAKLPFYKTKQENYGEIIKYYQFIQDLEYDNGKQRKDLTLTLNEARTKIVAHYRMQITPRHKQEKQQEQTFFERLFKRNPQKKDAVVNLLPAEECRYISLALNMQKGFGPSLNVDYITSSGDEIKKFYYIDNDGSLREKNKLENNKESNQ